MTLSILLYVYYAFLVIWLIVALIALFHILSYGMKGFVTFFATIIFIGVSGLILSSSFFYINQVDWEAPLPFIDIDYDFEIKEF